MAKIREAWSISSENGRVTVSGERAGAHEIMILVQEPGSDPRGDEPGATASQKMSADEWRDIVRAVEARLIRRGDPQRD